MKSKAINDGVERADEEGDQLLRAGKRRS